MAATEGLLRAPAGHLPAHNQRWQLALNTRGNNRKARGLVATTTGSQNQSGSKQASNEQQRPRTDYAQPAIAATQAETNQ